MNKINWYKILILSFILAMLPMVVWADNGEPKIDTASTNLGIVRISYKDYSGEPLKVLIEKSKVRYTYELKSDGTIESFPLQMGNGVYKVSVLQQVEGNSYMYLSTKDVNVKLKNLDIVFLNSTQNVKWDKNYKTIKKDIELTKDKTSIKDKFKSIYDFLVTNFVYDFSKAGSVKPGYLPNIDKTLQDKKGICYDYSSMLAAMNRFQGVPSKLVMGYSKKVNGYHAWNEFKINGNWIIVDTTYDSQMWGAKINYDMAKNPSDYKKMYEY